jgi:hypothetical protein
MPATTVLTAYKGRKKKKHSSIKLVKKKIEGCILGRQEREILFLQLMEPRQLKFSQYVCSV